MDESHINAKLGPSCHHIPEALQAQQQRQMAQAQAQQQGRESQLSSRLAGCVDRLGGIQGEEINYELASASQTCLVRHPQAKLQHVKTGSCQRLPLEMEKVDVKMGA